MNFDQLARAASAQLLATVEKEVDPMTMMQQLTTRRNRRRASMTVLGVVAVAACAALFALGPWRDQPAPQPARTPSTAPSAGGEVLLFRTGVGDVVSLFGTLPHVPVSGTTGLVSASFAPDGRSLAYVWSSGPRPGGGRLNSEVRVLDQQSGADQALGPCRYPCPVAWSADGRGVLTSATGGLRRYDVATGSWTQVPVPTGWVVEGLDVNDVGRVAITGATAGGESALMTVGLDGASPAVLVTTGRGWVTEPRWSPDGLSLAYLRRSARFDDMTADADLALRVVAADGTEARALATLGHCVCGGLLPGMDWSPEGQIAVAPSFEPFPLVTVSLTGTVTDTGRRGGGPIAWRPAG